MKHSHENTSSADPNTSHMQQPKYVNLKGFKGFTLRSNSPRTIQACKELGLDVDVLDVKDIHHFISSDVSEEIGQLRYQHYLNRTHQLFTEINSKRKELIQKKRQKPQSIETLERSKTMKVAMDRDDAKRQIDEMYNKSIFMVQRSAETLDKQDSCQDLYDLNFGMQKEIQRYNKHKQQKLREASIKIKEDGKRLELIEKIKQKDQHILNHLLKRQQDRQKHHETVRKKSENPRQQQGKKLEIKSLQREVDKSNLDDTIIHQQYLNKLKEKREKVLKRREEYEKMEDIELQIELEKIERKLQQSQLSYQLKQMQKIERIKEQQIKEQEQIKIQKSYNQQQSEEQLSTIIQRMIAKEQDFRDHLKQQLMSDIEKKQHQKEKQQKLIQKKQDIFKDQDEKLKKLNERFEKIEEYNRMRKQEQEHKILLKQELRRLKEQDKIENYERQKRQQDYRMQSLCQKSKVIEDKKELKQYTLDMLQKASIEINKFESQERQRIYSQLQQLSDNLFTYKCNSQHEPRTEKQAKLKSLKLLKGIADQKEFEENQKVVLKVFK